MGGQPPWRVAGKERQRRSISFRSECRMCERIDDTGDTAIKMSTDRELFFHCFFSIFCVHLAPDDVYIISECISLSVNIN